MTWIPINEITDYKKEIKSMSYEFLNQGDI